MQVVLDVLMICAVINAEGAMPVWQQSASATGGCHTGGSLFPNCAGTFSAIIHYDQHYHHACAVGENLHDKLVPLEVALLSILWADKSQA